MSQSDLESLAVPVAPLAEQAKIVSVVSSSLENANALGEHVRFGRLSVGQLNQSILAKAFRGELVPQDPNDEPASVLLERIRAERAGSATKAPKRGRKAKSG